MNPSVTVPRVVDDRSAIEDIVMTYATLVDTGNFEGLADLLADAGLGEEGNSPLLRGRDAILNLYRSTVRLYADGTPRTKHVTTNLQITMDADRAGATGSAYFTVLQCTEELPLQTVVAGRYHDRFERRDGRWRIVERRFATDLVGDMSHHMLGQGSTSITRKPSTLT